MKTSKSSSLADIEFFELESKLNHESQLVVYDEIYKRGAIRCFSIFASSEVARGNHAHIAAHQWFVAMTGQIQIESFDGKNSDRLVLNKASQVLSVPAGLWSRQTYSPNSILLVFTDTQYAETDYIRDLVDYKIWKFQ